MSRIQTPEMKALRKSINACELCGSKRNLEVHHIIPVVCGGDDSESNLMVVCGVCHAKLTPKGALSKIGIRNVKQSNLRNEWKIELYERIQKKLDVGEYGWDMIMDCIDAM